MNTKNESERLQLLAYNAFQSKDYDKALEIYLEILNNSPSNPEILYNIAVAYQFLHKTEDAKKYYMRYVELKKDAKAFNNLAVIALYETKTEAAKEYFHNAIHIDPKYLPSYLGLSQLYSEELNHIAANELLLSYPDYTHSTEIKTELAKNYNELGLYYYGQRNFEPAIEYFQKSLLYASENHLGKLYRNLTGCMIETGNIAELKRYVFLAYEKDPDVTVNVYHVGVYYVQTNQYGLGRDYFNKALESDPENILVLQGLANLELELENYEDAMLVIDQAYMYQSKNPQTMNIYGKIYHRQGKYNEALQWYLKALVEDESKALTLANIGSAYLSLHQLDLAKTYLSTSLEIDPRGKDALINLGQVAYNEGRYQDAISSFEKTLEYYPEDTLLHQNLSVLYFGLFRFMKGWESYRYRKLDKLQPKIALECGLDELPEDLTGKRILLRNEQGLGDELFFLRFIIILKERGAWIAYFPNPKLLDVLLGCPYIDLLLHEGETIDNIHYNLFVGELPRLLKIHSKEMIPPPLPLYVNETLPEKNSINIAKEQGQLIGITWRAGIQQFNHLSKEIPLSQLIAKLKNIDASIVVLQRNPTSYEMNELREAFGDRLIDASGYNEDLVTMLSVLSMLDAYIAVSNTNVHLAAGIRLKCYVLVPFPPEWRWGYETGKHSPWFSDFNVYRQSSYQGSWNGGLESLIKDIKIDLAEKKKFDEFTVIVNESIKKIEDLIEYQMYEDAERICHKILSLDEHNIQVLALLSKILLLVQRYEKLMQVNEKLMESITRNRA